MTKNMARLILLQLRLSPRLPAVALALIRRHIFCGLQGAQIANLESV